MPVVLKPLLGLRFSGQMRSKWEHVIPAAEAGRAPTLRSTTVGKGCLCTPLTRLGQALRVTRRLERCHISSRCNTCSLHWPFSPCSPETPTQRLSTTTSPGSLPFLIPTLSAQPQPHSSQGPRGPSPRGLAWRRCWAESSGPGHSSTTLAGYLARRARSAGFPPQNGGSISAPCLG